MASTTLTDAEREQRRAQERELVQVAVEQLRSSTGWQAWLATRSRFRTYSLRNQLLIAHQAPDATRVAGFKVWLGLGYCVRKGGKGLRIYAPCPPSKTRLQAWRDAGSPSDDKPQTFFRLTAVFDTSSRDLWSARSRGLSRREPGLLASSLEWSRGGAGEEPAGPDTLLAFLEGL